MANRTVKDAHSVKGTNPQYLVEKIIRTRIYESKFWKEQCFALSAELLVDKAMELRYIGGVYGGNVKPSPFLCLILKMLQIQPDKDIIVEFISQQDFKYVRALGALYMRLTGSSLDCYKYLEPLYLDYRKLRTMNKNGEFELLHVDEFIDLLLRDERVCDVILPRIQKRLVLEEGNQLPGKDNYLEDDMEDVESSEEEEEDMDTKEKSSHHRTPSPDRSRDWDKPRRSPSPRYRRSRSRSPHRSRQKADESRHRRDRDRRRSRSRERRGSDRTRDKRHREEEKSSHKKHKSHKDSDERRHHHKSKKSKKDKDEKKSISKEELEIQEQNELRAKLGLAPLR